MNSKLTAVFFSSIALFGTAGAQSGAFSGQTPVNAALKQTISSKNAKPGQEVAATTEKPVTLGSTTIPKGSQLLGHVVDVSKHSKESPNGSLTLVFDHVKPKSGGDAMPIRASIYRISLSEGQVLGQRRDTDMGMRGSAAERNTTPAVREGTDQEGRSVQGLQSAADAPVKVVSAVPGVSLSAVASDDRSGIMSAQNADVELGASMEMVIGISARQ